MLNIKTLVAAAVLSTCGIASFAQTAAPAAAPVAAAPAASADAAKKADVKKVKHHKTAKHKKVDAKMDAPAK